MVTVRFRFSVQI